MKTTARESDERVMVLARGRKGEECGREDELPIRCHKTDRLSRHSASSSSSQFQGQGWHAHVVCDIERRGREETQLVMTEIWWRELWEHVDIGVTMLRAARRRGPVTPTVMQAPEHNLHNRRVPCKCWSARHVSTLNLQLHGSSMSAWLCHFIATGPCLQKDSSRRPTEPMLEQKSGQARPSP